MSTINDVMREVEYLAEAAVKEGVDLLYEKIEQKYDGQEELSGEDFMRIVNDSYKEIME